MNFNILAVLAAVVGCILALKVFKRDQSKLKVDVKIDRRRILLADPMSWYLEITLRNIGRRVCYITRIDLKLPIVKIEMDALVLEKNLKVAKNLFRISEELNCIKLEEKDIHVLGGIVDKDLLRLLASDKFRRGTIFVTDSLGNESQCDFKLPAKELIEKIK